MTVELPPRIPPDPLFADLATLLPPQPHPTPKGSAGDTQPFHTHGHCACGAWLEGRQYCRKCGRGYSGPLLEAGSEAPVPVPVDADLSHNRGLPSDNLTVRDVGQVAADGVNQEDVVLMTTTVPSTASVTVSTNTANAAFDLGVPTPIPTPAPPLPVGIGMVGWRGVLAVEGRATGDGRMFRTNSLYWDESYLPADLFAMLADPDGGTGHDGSMIAGRIDKMWKQPSPDGSYTEVWAEGFYDTSTPTGAEVLRLQNQGMLTGVSVDVDSVEVVMPNFDELSDEDIFDLIFGSGVEEYSAGRIRRATVCSIPAFIEARIYPVNDAGTLVASAVSEGFAELRVWTPVENTAADRATLVASVIDNGAVRIGGWRTGNVLTAALAQNPMPNVVELAGLLGAEIVEGIGTLPAHATAVDLRNPAQPGVADASWSNPVFGYAEDAASNVAGATAGGSATTASQQRRNVGSLVASAPAAAAPRTSRPSNAANVPTVPVVGVPASGVGFQPEGRRSDAPTATSLTSGPTHAAGPGHSPTGGESKPSTASHPRTTGSYGVGSTANVLSAGGASMTYTDGTSMSTTATRPAVYGDSSAVSATRPSAFSVMTLKFSDGRQGTSARDEPFLNDLILNPPKWVFEKRDYSQYTPMTVDEHGVVSGMVTPWGACHLGFTDRCVVAPRTGCGYANARTGHVLTAEGDIVATGRIFSQFTPGRRGHAPEELVAAKAVEWYESMCLAVADVAIYEDGFGIQVQGRVRPGVSRAQVIALRASDISPDWRSISGRLECVGFATVNVSGFPNRQMPALVASAIDAGIEIPQAATADLHASAFIANGEVLTLVASGGPGRDPALALASAVQTLSARVAELEQIELARQAAALLADLPTAEDEQAALAALAASVLDDLDLGADPEPVVDGEPAPTVGALSADDLATLRAAAAIAERLTAATDPPAGDTQECPHCHEQIPADATECPNCGWKLGGKMADAADTVIAGAGCSTCLDGTPCASCATAAA